MGGGQPPTHCTKQGDGEGCQICKKSEAEWGLARKRRLAFKCSCVLQNRFGNKTSHPPRSPTPSEPGIKDTWFINVIESDKITHTPAEDPTPCVLI